MAKISGPRRYDDDLLTGSMEEHSRIQNYDNDAMNGIEAYYERHPEKYTPEIIERLNLSKPQFRNLSERQKQHMILHLDYVIRKEAHEELRKREIERAQRLKVERLREPRILVPTGVFFELIESENRGAEKQ